MNNVIPIIFNGGYYGTFVQWALDYFSGNIDYLPFENTGSSHKHQGPIIRGINEWRSFKIPSTPTLIRVHPKVAKDDNASEVVAEILQHAEKAILLTTADHTILTINNKFEKIWEDGWMAQQAELATMAWGSEKYDDLAIWEQREFLSFYIDKQHASENEYVRDTSGKLLRFDIGLLFDDFENSIRQLLKFINFPCVRDNFKEIYDTWRPLQVHYGKDKLVESIVDAVITDKYIEWSNLSLVDEAFVQMRLRDLHKLDMMCYNINVFPTNTTDLRKLLINV